MGGPFKYPGEGPLFNEWAWMGVGLLAIIAGSAVMVGAISGIAGLLS